MKKLFDIGFWFGAAVILLGCVGMMEAIAVENCTREDGSFSWGCFAVVHVVALAVIGFSLGAGRVLGEVALAAINSQEEKP